MLGRSLFRIETAVAIAGLAVLPACKNADEKKGVQVRAPEPLRVAAAADLTFAFKEAGEAYTKSTGTPVTFSFGSSGLLAKQIQEGAPFDVFAAASVSFAEDAVKSGACDAESMMLYATGRVVMWTKAGIAPPPTLESLTDPKWSKIAIANPEHAPYGRAAKEAITSAGIWDKVQSRLVYGENVQQTLQFAQSGNADVAIVALSLAKASGGAFTEIDSAAHKRIDQTLVVCNGARATPRDEARAFRAFVASDQGRAILRGHGFLLPGDVVVRAPVVAPSR